MNGVGVEDDGGQEKVPHTLASSLRVKQSTRS